MKEGEMLKNVPPQKKKQKKPKKYGQVVLSDKDNEILQYSIYESSE